MLLEYRRSFQLKWQNWWWFIERIICLQLTDIYFVRFLQNSSFLLRRYTSAWCRVLKRSWYHSILWWSSNFIVILNRDWCNSCLNLDCYCSLNLQVMRAQNIIDLFATSPRYTKVVKLWPYLSVVKKRGYIKLITIL